MTYDPRRACANARGWTSVLVDLTTRPEGWRGPGCYVVILPADEHPQHSLAVGSWIDPLTKRGTLRHTHHTGVFKFYQRNVGDTVHVFRIDEWSPPAADG